MEDRRTGGGGSRVRVGDAMICAESQHTIFGRWAADRQGRPARMSDGD